MSTGDRGRRVQVAGFGLLESAYRPRSQIRHHAHAHAKISLIVSGGTHENYLRDEHCCTAGSVVLKPAGADHSNVFSPAGMRTMIVFRLDSASQGYRDWHRTLNRYRWIHGWPVTRIMVSIYRSLLDASTCHLEGVEERLYRIIDLIQSETRRLDQTTSPRWLGTVRDYLHAQYTQQVEVRTLADMVQTHPVYLARVFRRRFGCSVTRYVQRLRTQRAMALLNDPQPSIARVALESGFADHAHLCRVFKSQMGLTPGGYRRLTLKS